MPWYYAGPGAAPVGPLSLEELHARRVQGAIQPDTYVIEHTGRASDVLAWRRYREVFPESAALPLMPPVPPPAHGAIPPAPPLMTGIHPQPSVPPVMPLGAPSPVFAPTHRPDPYYQQLKPTNGWCAWGFGLGLIGFFFSFACGMGLLLAMPSLLLCIVGLSQVNKDRAQEGKGLAVAGIVLSSFALVISLGIIGWIAAPVLRAHQLTVTEQTSNDSE